jgi:Pyridoxal-dependent decarboxylase, pyridoxal binding domain
LRQSSNGRSPWNRKYLPRVQAYYAVAEFLQVHEKIKHLPAKQRRISSGIASFTRTPSKRWKCFSGWIPTSLWSPRALPGEAHNNKLVVEGLSFHVGSQCANRENYSQALHLAAGIFSEAKARDFDLKLLDIGGGFPAHYDETAPPFRKLAEMINVEVDRLFPKPIEILAEPGRFLVASAVTAVSQIIGKAVRGGKLCNYLNDGVYHTYSGTIFNHARYPVRSKKAPPRSAPSSAQRAMPWIPSVSPSNSGLGDRQPGLLRKRGCISRCEQYVLQRLPARQGRAREAVSRAVGDRWGASRVRGRRFRRPLASYAWLSGGLQLLHQNFRVSSAVIVFLTARGRKVVARAFGKTAFRLKVTKRLRG